MLRSWSILLLIESPAPRVLFASMTTMHLLSALTRTKSFSWLMILRSERNLEKSPFNYSFNQVYLKKVTFLTYYTILSLHFQQPGHKYLNLWSVFILNNKIYRKVVSSRLSRLVAHFQIFRLFMKGKFEAYYCDLWAKGFKIE